MGCLAGQRAREKERATDRRKKRGGERERELVDGLRHSVDGRSGVVAASSP